MKRYIFVRTVINWLYNYAPFGGPQQRTEAAAAAAEKKEAKEEKKKRKEGEGQQKQKKKKKREETYFVRYNRSRHRHWTICNYYIIL
jgi:hypothetical protein